MVGWGWWPKCLHMKVAPHFPHSASQKMNERGSQGTMALSPCLDQLKHDEWVVAMPKLVTMRLLLTVALFVSAEVKQAHGFVHPPSHAERCCFPSSSCRNECSPIRSKKRIHTNLCHGTRTHRESNSWCAAASDDGQGLSDEIIQIAEQKLPWEVAAERQSRPVLDLSGGRSGINDSDLSLADAASAVRGKRQTQENETNTDDHEVGAVDWSTGGVWRETKQALIEMAILSEATEELFLSKCPQLARLPTEDVVETANFLVNTIGMSPSAIAQYPSLLSYPAHLFPGAMEFSSNMMMLPQPMISSLCRTNPDLLIGGLDGYIQEQSVKNALGSAGDALYGVGRSVANDVGKTMRDRRDSPKGL